MSATKFVDLSLSSSEKAQAGVASCWKLQVDHSESYDNRQSIVYADKRKLQRFISLTCFLWAFTVSIGYVECFCVASTETSPICLKNRRNGSRLSSPSRLWCCSSCAQSLAIPHQTAFLRTGAVDQSISRLSMSRPEDRRYPELGKLET